MTPKVSVIIPVYNTEEHLSDCLDSVLSQTLDDIEVIVVDDGSTDGSYSLACGYAERDSRVVVLRQENCNAGAARNLGLTKATGQYLSFLDSDDFFDPQMLEKGYRAAVDCNAQVVVWRARRYIEDADVFEPVRWTVKEKYLPGTKVFAGVDIEENFYLALMGYAWDKLFERAFIEKLGITFQSQPVFNDSLFTYGALSNAERITFLDEVLITQRKRSAKDSISDRRAKYWTSAYTLLAGLRARLEADSLYSRFQQDFVNYAVHLLLLDLETKTGENRALMEEAIKRYWAEELDVAQHLNNANYFYNKNQLLQFRALCEGPLKHSSLRAKDIPRSAMAPLDEKPITIPVAFSTDENYVYPTAVALTSLLQRASGATRYDVYILVEEGFSPKARETLTSIGECYPGHNITFVSPGGTYGEADICIDHITRATYYRLSLASLLPKVDKCIYLDSDIVVRDDLRSLYETDLGTNLMAGVRAFAYFRTEGTMRHKMAELGVDSWEIYVNAGVLLLNLAAIREEGLEAEFTSLLDRKFSSQDQDILNLACRNRIKLLPFKYNVMTKYDVYDSELHANSFLKDWVGADEWNEGRRLPVIIHYADKRKPWKDASTLYAEAWWDVVKTLPDAMQAAVLEQNIDLLIENASINNEEFLRLQDQQRRLKSYLQAWGSKKAAGAKRRLHKYLGR